MDQMSSSLITIYVALNKEENFTFPLKYVALYEVIKCLT